MTKFPSDLTGLKFGRLKVLALDIERSQPHKQRWICRCECGIIKSILRNNLTQGTTVSCGCYGRERSSTRVKMLQKKPRDITGMESGYLTVLGMVDNSHPPLCKCICKCGNVKLIDARRVKQKRVTSCGCKTRALRKNLVDQRFDRLVVLERAENYYSPITGKAQTRYRCKCDCGKEIVTTARALTAGLTRSCGCLRSYAERETETVLKDMNITYQREYRFADCIDKRTLPFDFAIFNEEGKLVTLIELDGSQHYKPTSRGYEAVRAHDVIKSKYCDDNNIPLLRIPYWEFNNLKTVLRERLKYYAT